MDINILYCIDEYKKDYARHLWVSMISLLKNNKLHNIQIYVISSVLYKDNKLELKRIADKFWANIIFSKGEIIPKNIQKILQFDKLGIAAFYRLFYKNCFPNIKDKLLYLDCDTIVCWDISQFYADDLWDNLVAWSLDIPWFRYIKSKQIGTDYKEYINSWVLIFNIEKFNKLDIWKEIVKINKTTKIYSADQDYINIIAKNRKKLINIQTLAYRKFWIDINRTPILHAVNKPFLKYSGCPKNIISLYNNYLNETKRKNYNEEWKFSIWNYLTYWCGIIRDFYDYLTSFLWERIQIVNYSLMLKYLSFLAFIKGKFLYIINKIWL